MSASGPAECIGPSSMVRAHSRGVHFSTHGGPWGDAVAEAGQGREGMPAQAACEGAYDPLCPGPGPRLCAPWPQVLGSARPVARPSPCLAVRWQRTQHAEQGSCD